MAGYEELIIGRAETFATAAHAAVGQRRKYTDEPYIVHPRNVAELVRSVGGTYSMIAAAWLHDVVEDTKVTLEDIRATCDDETATYVDWLTDKTKPIDGNREHRKCLDRCRLAEAPPEVKTIKLADLIDNSESILARDPEFAKVYLPEKKNLMWVLKEGNHKLLCRAMDIIMEYEDHLLQQKLETKEIFNG